MAKQGPFGGVGKPQKKTIPQPSGNPAGRKGVPDFTIGGKKVNA